MKYRLNLLWEDFIPHHKPFTGYKCLSAAWARNIMNGLSSPVRYTTIKLEYVSHYKYIIKTTWCCLKSGQTEYD